MTNIRELTINELDLVSGGVRITSQSTHDGLKFTLYSDGNLVVTAGNGAGVSSGPTGTAYGANTGSGSGWTQFF